ncbi:MAG: hypothetical protein HQ481_21760 [Alphaproteobacteria bacterium]|nr:hypothetical protein [Alphaproteobacteria bacterium]
MWTIEPETSSIWREIAELHVFFVDWFTGACADDDAIFDARFTSRFDANALYVMPGGDVHAFASFAAKFQAAHGSNPNFGIHIRSVRSRALGEEQVLALYEELQRGAKASEHAENARLTTAVFRQDATMPNGLKWLHLHETWLPEDARAAADFAW